MNVVLDALDAPPLVRGAAALAWPFKWLGYKGDPAMPPATRALTALGPAYIKFGQILSTRPDVVGDELALQLRVLQDKLPPFDRGLRQGSGRRGAGRARSKRCSRISASPSPRPRSRRSTRAAGRKRRGGGRQGAAPRDRTGLPQGHRRLLFRRPHDRVSVAGIAPLAPDGCDRPFRGRGAGRARSAAGSSRPRNSPPIPQATTVSTA